MKTNLGILLLLVLAATLSLILPTRIRLELHDVQDVACYTGDWGINTGPIIDHDAIDGEELARRISSVLPGSWNGDSERTMQYQNGLIVARTTAAQHVAIRVYLTAYRVKTTICDTLLGIIRR